MKYRDIKVRIKIFYMEKLVSTFKGEIIPMYFTNQYCFDVFQHFLAAAISCKNCLFLFVLLVGLLVGFLCGFFFSPFLNFIF